MESLEDAESDRGGLPGEGVQDPEDFPASRLGFEAQICKALGACAPIESNGWISFYLITRGKSEKAV